MALERVSLEAEITELKRRVLELEDQEKMGYTSQVGGTYRMIEDIEDEASAELTRLRFGFFEGVGAEEDGFPSTGDHFGFTLLNGDGVHVFEVDDAGMVLPAMPLVAVTSGRSWTSTSTSWTSVISGGGSYSVLYNAVRVQFGFSVAGGTAQFRLAEVGGTGTNFSDATVAAASGIASFRWLHERPIGDENGPLIDIQSVVSSGTVTISDPTYFHQIGGDHIGATIAGEASP